MEIWGLCLKCRHWFSCDAWFDRSVPTPCCPTCQLVPGAIRYDRPDAPVGDARAGDRVAVSSELWLG